MASLFSFGQSGMFWNNYSNFNPAMSGFQYSQHASATYTNYYPALSGNYSSVYADYGMSISNHGVGINYTGGFYSATSNKLVLNYNYQFYFKKAGKLSLGTGIGVGRYQIKSSNTIFPQPTGPTEPIHSFELNTGIAYNWKNLLVGFSASGLTPPEQSMISTFYYVPRPSFNFHAQYAFQIAEKFQLTPRVLYAYQDGFQRLQPNLTLTYNNMFSLGVSSEFRDNLGVNIGWDIKNKFRVAYMYSATISKLNNGVSGGVHEFSLSYILKKKPVICDVGMSPK